MEQGGEARPQRLWEETAAGERNRSSRARRSRRGGRARSCNSIRSEKWGRGKRRCPESFRRDEKSGRRNSGHRHVNRDKLPGEGINAESKTRERHRSQEGGGSLFTEEDEGRGLPTIQGDPCLPDLAGHAAAIGIEDSPLPCRCDPERAEERELALNKDLVIQ